MKIQGNENNIFLLKELGSRIKDTRIAFAQTRKDFSAKAGISLKTMERIENGENVKIENLLNVLRSLELLQNLDILIPEQEDLFIQDNRGKKKRVSKTQNAAKEKEWKWGDEV